MATTKQEVPSVVPRGSLRQLTLKDIKPSSNNPRMLFDPQPLAELRENIRVHGVLVPITVYQIRGQDRYAILDGERRYRCCEDLAKEGVELRIPANVVEPPNKLAGLLYMFSIHNFREPWELMPTALSLEVVMKELGEVDPEKLSHLTGLSIPQIERCKTLLAIPERYQKLSLDPEPETRIPANFWIESGPVLDLAKEITPKVYARLGKWGVQDKLVEKYKAGKIKSVIHFRRIMEANEVVDSAEERRKFADRLEEYVTNVELETRRAFDEFVVDNRRLSNAIGACEEFISKLERAKVTYALDREELRAALNKVLKYVERLLEKLKGSDAPGKR
jgi:ParB family transcriptional regulator, chromosome partitioning protein